MERFQKHISRFEKATAVVFYMMLLLCIVTQLFFGGGATLLTAVIAVISALFSWLVFAPEHYELKENALVICRGVSGRCMDIRYDSIISIDSVGNFRSAKRDLDSVEVVIKYRLGDGRRRSVSCHPKNVLGFVRLLQDRCPNLEPDLD